MTDEQKQKRRDYQRILTKRITKRILLKILCSKKVK